MQGCQKPNAFLVQDGEEAACEASPTKKPRTPEKRPAVATGSAAQQQQLGVQVPGQGVVADLLTPQPGAPAPAIIDITELD